MNRMTGQTDRHTCSQCCKSLGQSLQLPLCCLFYTHRTKDTSEQVLSVYGCVYLDLCSASATSWAEVVSLCLTKPKVGAGEFFWGRRYVTSDLAPHHLGHAILGQDTETAGSHLITKWPVAIPCTNKGGWKNRWWSSLPKAIQEVSRKSKSGADIPVSHNNDSSPELTAG